MAVKKNLKLLNDIMMWLSRREFWTAAFCCKGGNLSVSETCYPSGGPSNVTLIRFRLRTSGEEKVLGRHDGRGIGRWSLIEGAWAKGQS